MSPRESSCRPVRLERFAETIDAVCDGLVTRAGVLDEALAAYRASCDVQFRAPTVDTGSLVRSLAAGLRDMGRWTGAVGGAFRAAADDAGVPDLFRLDITLTLADAEIVDDLQEWPDPYRRVAAGAAAQLARDVGADYDPDGPPAWVDLFASGGNVGDVLSPLLEGTAMAMADVRPGPTVTVLVESATIAVLTDGTLAARFARTEVSARLLLPSASAARLSSAASWVGNAGTALAFVAGAGEQWYSDAGLPTQERLARAVVRGGGMAGGSLAGGWAGVQLGASCGPAAPVCSTVFGIGGAFLGGFLGDEFVDALPFMDSPEPGEHDLDTVTDTIAAEDGGDVSVRLAAQADLQASDLAVLATADDPALNERVVSILPDDDELARIIAFDDASAPPWGATGTTTTSTTSTTSSTSTTSTTTTTTTTTIPTPVPGTPPTTVPSPRPDADPSAPPDPWVGDRLGS